MRRLLPVAALVVATLSAAPALAWEHRPHGYGWRPAPSWHQPYRHHGWHRPWRPPHHAWRGDWRQPHRERYADRFDRRDYDRRW